MIESWVDVRADIEAVNRGEAIRRGNLYEIGGRTYLLEPNGTMTPVSGPGIHLLDRAAYRALGVYNQFGLSPAAERILDRMNSHPAAREAARRAYLAERNPP